MSQTGGTSWKPVIAWSIIVVIAVSVALLIGGGVWMTVFLVAGLIAFMFDLIALFGHIP